MGRHEDAFSVPAHQQVKVRWIGGDESGGVALGQGLNQRGIVKVAPQKIMVNAVCGDGAPGR